MTARAVTGSCAAMVSQKPFDEIITNLHRRDNLDYFVDGLVRTEIFPYPEGQRGPVGSAYVPWSEVYVCPLKWHEMRDIALGKAITIENGTPQIVDLAISLLPEEGTGCYIERVVNEYEDDPEPESEHDRVLTLPQVRQIRSALWARYEWVVDKVAHVQDLRKEQASNHARRDEEDVMMMDDDLSEEADPYDSDMDSEPPSDPETDDSDSSVTFAFPLDKALGLGYKQSAKYAGAALKGKEVTVISNDPMNEDTTARVTHTGPPEVMPDIPDKDQEIQETQAALEDEARSADMQKISHAVADVVRLMSGISKDAAGSDAFKVAVSRLATVSGASPDIADVDTDDENWKVAESLRLRWGSSDPTKVGTTAYEKSSGESRNRFRRMMARIGAAHEVASLSQEQD